MYALVVRLLEPYTLLFMGLCVAMIFVWRRQRPRGGGLIAAVVLLVVLWIVSMPVVGYVAVGSLEWSYPPRAEAPGAADTIVVLGADRVVVDEEGRQVRLGSSTFQRCHAAAQLYRRAGGCRLVVSGGKSNWSEPGPTVAESMREFLMEVGVPGDHIVLEDKSSSTYENSLYTKAVLEQFDPGRIWLVTEAMHMGRAERCFRAAGVNVTPAPCDHRAVRHELQVISVIPAVSGLSAVTRAAHEWLGRAWYRARGWL